jgi:proline iminopeptidase
MRAEEVSIEVANGVRLHCRRLGDGARTLVVPNGDYLLDAFASLADEHTLFVYDPRNRGRSDAVTDPALLKAGIRNDVDDLDRVRQHFGLERFELLCHSYAGLLAGLYAVDHPDRVARLVLLAPVQPFAGKQYAADLTYDDGVLRNVFARLQQLQQQPLADVVERCRQAWLILREIYVTDSRDAARTDWGRCELANERNFMGYWMQYLLPSIQATQVAVAQMANVTAPTLVVHGRKDRSAPYGGGRDWAAHLPNARLLSIAEGGHAPWVEAPEVVFAAVETFLAGEWPAAAERVIFP